MAPLTYWAMDHKPPHKNYNPIYMYRTVGIVRILWLLGWLTIWDGGSWRSMAHSLGTTVLREEDCLHNLHSHLKGGLLWTDLKLQPKLI